VKYGDDVALLAGDALLSYAFEHIARDTKAPPEKVLRVISELGKSVGSVGLVGGQVMPTPGTTFWPLRRQQRLSRAAARVVVCTKHCIGSSDCPGVDDA
jgi:hypothetical protein